LKNNQYTPPNTLLANDQEVIETLHQVYDNEVEELDILVGLMAEKKIKDLPLVRLLLLYSLSWHPGVCVCIYIYFT
jgi:hypothetical protein